MAPDLIDLDRKGLKFDLVDYLDGCGLDWFGLATWIEVDQIGLDWHGLKFSRLVWLGFATWVGFNEIGLDWI